MSELQAWFMEENDEDKRLPHHGNPKELVPLTKLAGIIIHYPFTLSHPFRISYNLFLYFYFFIFIR